MFEWNSICPHPAVLNITKKRKWNIIWNNTRVHAENFLQLSGNRCGLSFPKHWIKSCLLWLTWRSWRRCFIPARTHFPGCSVIAFYSVRITTPQQPHPNLPHAPPQNNNNSYLCALLGMHRCTVCVSLCVHACFCIISVCVPTCSHMGCVD